MKYQILVHTIGKYNYEPAGEAKTKEDAELIRKAFEDRRDKLQIENPNSELAKHTKNLEWEIIEK